MSNTKQLKITKLFKKSAKKAPNEDQELENEIQNLNKILRHKHLELLQIKRTKYKCKLSMCKNKPTAFVKPQSIILENSIENMKRNLELMSMLSGIEVQSFVAGEHCCIVYHLQHDAEHEVKDGLWIDMSSGTNKVAKCSFPVGFNFKAVINEFDNVMTPTCLSSIKKALVAYYNRLAQFKALKKLLSVPGGQLFSKLDTSFVKISFYVQSIREIEDKPMYIDFILEYRICDVRPKKWHLRNCDSHTPDDIDVIKSQCSVFTKKPLQKAFKEAFMDGYGPFKLVEQFQDNEVNQQRPKHFPRNNRNYNNDDTFQPGECTDPSEDEDTRYL